MSRVAVIDIGTVTARLAISTVEGGRVLLESKVSTICNLGEGVDKTGLLSDAACERVEQCVASYVARAREEGVESLCCTLTSAARDAANSAQLTDALRALGLVPQVIEGEVEGRLTFLGVAQDFPGSRILVADNGGGSTELACGVLTGEGLALDLVCSTDVGCRRITDKYLSGADLPSADDLREAHAFAAGLFAPVIEELGRLGARPTRLVACGGTVTSLVAMAAELEPYDSSLVHLHSIAAEKVGELESMLAGLTVEQRAGVVGLQAKRAPVILAGTVAISELMAQAGFDELTVSESDLLVGLSLATDAAVRGVASPVGWVPELAELADFSAR